MFRARVTIDKGLVANHRRQSIQRIEQAGLKVTARAASTGKRELRSSMRAAKLAGLAQAIGETSDLARNGRVHRRGADGFSVSGVLYVRSKSERTLGALESYFFGATITPKRGRWLWIASNDLKRRVKGGFRMTPERYVALGMEQSIGKLEFRPGRAPGEGLLVARRVTTLASGRRGSARAYRDGRSLRNRRLNEELVLFVGIRRTTRVVRVDPRSIIRAAQQRLPDEMLAELRRGR